MKRIMASLLALSLSAPAMAGLISVSQDGVDVDVSWTVTGQRIDFVYTADFTGAGGNVIGSTADALSFQLGSAGGGASIIDDFQATATSTADGVWTGVQDKVSGNGCDGTAAGAICYTVLPTGEGSTATGADGGQIIAAAVYTWEFWVDMVAGVDIPTLLAGEHSVKFLSLKQQGGRDGTNWSTALQLSQSGEDTSVTKVPEPATVVLLSLGLIGLGLRKQLKTG